MARKFVFNGLTGKLDLVDDDVNIDSSIPVGQADGYFTLIEDGSSNGLVYYFINGHRFKLVGTLDDPASGGYVGANAALSLLGP